MRNTTLRVVTGAGVAVIAMWLFGRLLLSLSWLTTPSWTVAWVAAIGIGVIVFIGLDRSARRPGPPAS